MGNELKPAGRRGRPQEEWQMKLPWFVRYHNQLGYNAKDKGVEKTNDSNSPTKKESRLLNLRGRIEDRNTGQIAPGVSCGGVEEAGDRSPEKVFLVATVAIRFKLSQIRLSRSTHLYSNWRWIQRHDTCCMLENMCSLTALDAVRIRV
ncbi:hypothetical protein KCV07_g182, partial [Aureobasidium melanogenum]